MFVIYEKWGSGMWVTVLRKEKDSKNELQNCMGKVLSKREEVLNGRYGCTEKRRAKHKRGVCPHGSRVAWYNKAHSVNNAQRNHVIGYSPFFFCHGPCCVYSFFSQVTRS